MIWFPQAQKVPFSRGHSGHTSRPPHTEGLKWYRSQDTSETSSAESSNKSRVGWEMWQNKVKTLWGSLLPTLLCVLVPSFKSCFPSVPWFSCRAEIFNHSIVCKIDSKSWMWKWDFLFSRIHVGKNKLPNMLSNVFPSKVVQPRNIVKYRKEICGSLKFL